MKKDDSHFDRGKSHLHDGILAVCRVFPGVFVQLFNSSSPELYEMTTWAARIYMGMTGIFGIQMAIQQTFMSLGQQNFPYSLHV